jgi:DNA-binding response OmpR family regulator
MHMQIGILDDNPAMCRFLETALSVEGYTVSASTDPLRFISLVCADGEEEWECIIVDFHLPGEVVGTDIIRQVRRRYPDIPAILISASEIPGHALEGLSQIAIFQKPFHLAKLFALLKTLD